jgi:cystathionine beta-lyase
VTLMSGTDFGTAGRGHARLNFATTTAVLDEALERLAGFLGAR